MHFEQELFSLQVDVIFDDVVLGSAISTLALLKRLV